MGLLIVNEQTTMLVDVYFWDEDGVAVTPDSATYRLDNAETGSLILAATSMGAMATMKTLNITPAQNAILDASHRFETHVVTVDWTYNTTRHGTDEYRYTVKNLIGIP